MNLVTCTQVSFTLSRGPPPAFDVRLLCLLQLPKCIKDSRGGSCYPSLIQTAFLSQLRTVKAYSSGRSGVEQGAEDVIPLLIWCLYRNEFSLSLQVNLFISVCYTSYCEDQR